MSDTGTGPDRPTEAELRRRVEYYAGLGGESRWKFSEALDAYAALVRAAALAGTAPASDQQLLDAWDAAYYPVLNEPWDKQRPPDGHEWDRRRLAAFHAGIRAVARAALAVAAPAAPAPDRDVVSAAYVRNALADLEHATADSGISERERLNSLAVAKDELRSALGFYESDGAAPGRAPAPEPTGECAFSPTGSHVASSLPGRCAWCSLPTEQWSGGAPPAAPAEPPPAYQPSDFPPGNPVRDAYVTWRDESYGKPSPSGDYVADMLAVVANALRAAPPPSEAPRG